MDKIHEALSKLLPEEQVAEVNSAVEAMLAEAKEELEQQYNTNLEEAYSELSKELKTAEETAEQGYQEAYDIIADLRNRLETQRVEYEKALEEGYEEAYQMLVDERGKNENIGNDLFDEYEKKYQENREYIVEKVHEFLQEKGKEIYEQARRDILNDPRMAEHKVALDKVVETVSGYISDEDYSVAFNSKVKDLEQMADDLKGQVRMLEARNIRLSTENGKLNESVRNAQELLSESKQVLDKTEKKERIEKAENVQGSGQKVLKEGEELITETVDEPTEPKKEVDTTLVESMDPEALKAMKALAGVK